MTASPSDVRVVPAAALCWALAAMLTRAPAGWALAVAAVAAVTVVWGWRRAALAFPALCLLLIAVVAGWRGAIVESSPVRELAERGAVVTAELQVRQDGRAFAGRSGPGTFVPVVIRQVESRQQSWRVRVRATAFMAGAVEDLTVGTSLRVRARLGPADSRDEAATLQVRRWTRIDAGPWWWRWSERVRAGVRAGVAHRDDQAAALVPALVTGDESALTDTTRDRFATTGLTHLLAVSGANLTIVLGVVMLALRSSGASRRALLVGGLLTVIAFVLVARPEPSVQRAAVMGTVGLAGLMAGGSGGGLRALAWAVIALLTVDPWLSGRPGFVLSVSATAGIVVLAGPITRRLAWLPRPIAVAAAVPLAAHLACLPAVAALSGEISLVAVFANVAAAPMIAPATIAGLAAGLIAMAAPTIAVLPGTVAWLAASVVVVIARLGASLPGASVVWSAPAWTLIPVAAGVGWALLALARRPALAVGVTMGLIVAMVRPPSPGWPPDGVLFAACDVGQGDALVLPTGPGEAIVVDVGQEPTLIDRCLRELGVERIALLLFTHADADHVAGWRGAVRGRQVAAVADGPSGGPAPRSARRLRLTAGQTLTVGPVRLEVLWPAAAEAEPADAERNDQSVVVRAVVAGRRILLTGDLGEEAQRALARRNSDLSADVLKVAHHGSADQWPGLLERVRPSVAVIGVGAGNPYGHPDPSVLSALAALGVPVWRTDESGTIAVRDSGGRLVVSVR